MRWNGIHSCHCEPSAIKVMVITTMRAHTKILPYSRHASFSKYSEYIISFNPHHDSLPGTVITTLNSYMSKLRHRCDLLRVTS